MQKYKYLFGSKMLKLDNNRDEDWLVFVDKRTKIAREMGCHSIPFYLKIIDCFIKGNRIRAEGYPALFLYQLSNGFINDADYPFCDFNIFEHKDVWKKWLKAYVNSENTEAQAIATDILPKRFYHLLYQYHMIVENEHWISDEAKADVQKIHDLEMSSQYFYELRDFINSL